MTTLNDIINIGTDKIKEHKRDDEKKEVKLKRHKIERQNAIHSDNQKSSFVICRTRALTLSELIHLNKQFSVLEYKDEYHKDKKAEKLIYECLILDFHDKRHIKWYKTNQEYIKKHNFVINLALQKKSLKHKDIQKLKDIYMFDSVIKKIDIINDGKELLTNMLIDHISMPQNGCLDACYRLVNNINGNKKN